MGDVAGGGVMDRCKLWMGLLLCMATLVCFAGQPGVTETVFNRRFIPTIKPSMTYEQVVKLAGAPGAKTGEDPKGNPPTVQYRWQGGRDSVLTVKFANNKMIEATVLAPNKHTYLIRANGEVVER